MPRKPLIPPINSRTRVVRTNVSVLSIYDIETGAERVISSHTMSRETVGVENPFKQYEEEFIFKSYTVEQMAARCNISESAFKHHFFEHYHTTPYQWLRMQRLSLAAQTLVEEDLSIKQISNKYQFSQESHFIKCFKQQFGLTPKNFRKEYRKQE